MANVDLKSGAEHDRQARAILPAISVTIIALVCYLWNAFRTASETLRGNLQSDTDRLVLDALGTNSRVLGTQGAEGFTPYLSQYGGQLDLYKLLGFTAADPSPFLITNGVALAVVVGALTFQICKRGYGVRGGLAFGLVLALSPWMVMFSRSLYWVTWAWFLPLLLTFAFGDEASVNKKRLTLLCGALFAISFSVFWLATNTPARL